MESTVRWMHAEETDGMLSEHEHAQMRGVGASSLAIMVVMVS